MKKRKRYTNPDSRIILPSGNLPIEQALRSLANKLVDGAESLKRYAEQEDNVIYVTPSGVFVGGDKREFDVRKYILRAPIKDRNFIFIYRVEHHDHKLKGKYRMLDVDCDDDLFRLERQVVQAIAYLFFENLDVTMKESSKGWHVVQEWTRESFGLQAQGISV